MKKAHRTKPLVRIVYKVKTRQFGQSSRIMKQDFFYFSSAIDLINLLIEYNSIDCSYKPKITVLL